jgi:hypothetical protein
VRGAAKQDYHLSAIVSGIVTSDAFRMQAATSAKASVPGASAETTAPKAAVATTAKKD